jgi:hypothetical protein
MAASLEDFLTVKNSHAQRLLLPYIRAGALRRARHIRVADAVASAGWNVHAIGVGSKMVAGKPTRDLCIRIYVIQKLPRSLIAPHFHLPETLDGLPTDIIESAPTFLLTKRRGSAKISGRSKAKGSKPIPKSLYVAEAEAGVHGDAATDDCSPSNLRSMQRPLFGGISVANAGVLAGTLGCFCRSIRTADDPGALYILSNRHILGKVDGEPEDDEILQPSIGNGGTSDKWVARYAHAADLDLSPNARNKVDAAIAKIRPDVKVKPEICGIGRLGDPVTVAIEEVVRKCGQTTGLTRGIVRDISKDTPVPLPFDPQGRCLYMAEQIRIEPVDRNAFVNPGDSGSIVVGDTSNGVIGLICGGDPGEGWAVANPIQNVLETLQIALL